MLFEIEVAAVPGLENRLRELRKERGLSLEALAEIVDVHHTTLGRLERGEMKLTDEYMEKLSAALKVHPAELIVDVGKIARTDREQTALELLRKMPDDAAESWLSTGKHLTSE